MTSAGLFRLTPSPSMSHYRTPKGCRKDPGDAPADDDLTDFERSLVESIRRAAKKAEVKLQLSPLVDACRDENGNVTVNVTVSATFSVMDYEVEIIDDAINSVAIPMAHLWSQVK